MTSAVPEIVTDALPEWDRFVSSHPEGTIYHLNGWRRALEMSFPHISGRLLVTRDSESGAIRAGLPFCQVRSRLLGNRWVSVPFAPFCDPLVHSASDEAPLIRAALDCHERSHTDYVQLRLLKAEPTDPELGFSESRFYKYHRLALAPDLETLRKGFHADAVRRMLNRAERLGVVVSAASGPKDLFVYYRLFLQQRQMLGLPPIPRRFFESLFKVFFDAGLVRFYLARLGSRVIGASFGFSFNGLEMPEFLVVEREFRNQGVTQALYWHGVCEARRGNCHHYGFGRTALSNEGLMAFKQRWGTEQLDIVEAFYPAAENVALHEKEKSFKYRAISTLARLAPPSILVMLGKFCYHHMG